MAVTFDQRRFETARVIPKKNMQFNEIILFDFDLPHTLDSNDEIKFDKKLVELMRQPLMLEVIHQRGGKIQVIGTKTLDWKSLMVNRPN